MQSGFLYINNKSNHVWVKESLKFLNNENYIYIIKSEILKHKIIQKLNSNKFRELSKYINSIDLHII